MADLRKLIIGLMRKDARSNLSSFSRERGVSLKKVHYEFNKLRGGFDKFVPFLDFELLGFKRLIVIFDDAVEGLALVSKVMPFYVNNSIRLDSGLFVEYVFMSSDEQLSFLSKLNERGVSFKYYFVDEVLKQEGSLLS